MRVLSCWVILRPETEGGFTVTVPALSGCITYGRDIGEAKEMVKDAIQVYLESLQKHSEPIFDDADTLETQLSIQIQTQEAL